MFEGIKTWLFKKKIEKITKNVSPYEDFLEEQLKSTAQQYALTLRESDKLKKLVEAQRRMKELSRVTTEAHKKLTQPFKDEYDDEDEEEEEDLDDEDEEAEEENFMDKLLNDLIKKHSGQILGSKVAPSVGKVAEQNSPLSPTKQKALDMLKNIPDDKIEKYLGMIK